MTNPDREELVKIADIIEASRGLFTMHDDKPRQLGIRQSAVVIAALRRLASSEGGVKVRELAWREPAGCFSATSRNSIGNYNIEDNGPNWSHDRYHLRLTFFGELGRFSTLESAKAAAQADYEARIRSALVEVPAVKGEPEPYAYEYGKSNGDGTYSVVIERPPLRSQVSDWPTKPLFGAPPADAGMREALELAHGKFCKIAGTEAWTDSCLDGWRRSPGALRDYAEQAAKEIDAALTAPGATTKSDGGFDECAASGQSCIYAGDGPNGEFQCIYCGKPNEPKSDVEALAATTAERPGTVTSEPEPSTSDQCGAKRCADYGCFGYCMETTGPSDPSSTRSDVTVEFGELVDDLLTVVAEVRRQNWKNGGAHDYDDEDASRKVARALLDQFEIRRK